MAETDQQSTEEELAQLRERIAELEAESDQPPPHWEASGFYLTYYATAGFFLGMVAAMASLMMNVIGSALVDQHPLRLIQVYLTFPLGEQALELSGGLALTLGCCLYLATGMVFGIVFHVALRWFTHEKSFWFRLTVATGLALGMWVVHYYGVLSWLQPLMFGGDWIVALIPLWVGALTHLVYGWTMAVIYPLGLYHPYQRVAP